MPVHNHGTEEGEGLACRELWVNGELKGACLREETKRIQINAPVNIRSAEKLGLTEPISELYVGMYD